MEGGEEHCYPPRPLKWGKIILSYPKIYNIRANLEGRFKSGSTYNSDFPYSILLSTIEFLVHLLFCFIRHERPSLFY